MWIDIHAHLYDKTDDDLTLCIKNAHANKIDIIVNSSTNIETADIIIEQIRDRLGVYGTVGISPFDVEVLPPNWQGSIKDLLPSEKIIGVGEIGLDDSNPRYPALEKQIPVFEQLLETAKESGIPAIMHSRGAEKTVFDFCRNQSIEKAVFHCFTGSKTVLRQLLDAGYYVSYSGIITFNNNPLYGHIQYTPLDRLFIETDSPYLAPHPFRGKQNEPAHVAIIGKKAAEIKGILPDEVAKQIRHNFSTLFNISVSDT